MVIQSAKLDPNAQSYTDDQIVGKVNAAAVPITRADAIGPASLGDVDLDDIADGTTSKSYTNTEKTKLGGVTEGAEPNVGEEFTTGEQTKLTGISDGAQPDQTGPEVRDLILAIADTERGLVVTDPTTGQFKVVSIERDPDGKMNIKYDDVPES